MSIKENEKLMELSHLRLATRPWIWECVCLGVARWDGEITYDPSLTYTRSQEVSLQIESLYGSASIMFPTGNRGDERELARDIGMFEKLKDELAFIHVLIKAFKIPNEFAPFFAYGIAQKIAFYGQENVFNAIHESIHSGHEPLFSKTKQESGEVDLCGIDAELII